MSSERHPTTGPTPEDPVIEHAILMGGGGMHVRKSHPDLDRIYPLNVWIENQQRFGGKVYRRRIIVLEDWTEEGTP